MDADSKLVLRVYGELHEEAIAVAEGRWDMSAAVARLVQLIPPMRVDLVDEVLHRVGRRTRSAAHDWPPARVLHELAYLLKQVHAGNMLRGQSIESYLADPAGEELGQPEAPPA